jgi:D-alanyl-D-alanine carboxypeptidase
MTKMFTAVAVAQLAERGTLALSDPIARHLPDYPNADVARRVTIEQLLTHTSGMGSFWNARYAARRDSLFTLADYVPLFAGDPLSFEPGARFGYSNAGYIVLGRIVEAASGMSYYDYVQRHIFEPAGMRNTGFYDRQGKAANVAIGYTRQGAPAGQRVDHAPGGRELRGGSAGGGYSTAEDLLAFGRALAANTLMSAESARRFTTGAVAGPGGPASYGYGFMTRLAGTTERVAGHNGGAPGTTNHFYTFPDRGLSVVLLTSRDSEETRPTWERMRQAVVTLLARPKA